MTTTSSPTHSLTESSGTRADGVGLTASTALTHLEHAVRAIRAGAVVVDRFDVREGANITLRITLSPAVSDEPLPRGACPRCRGTDGVKDVGGLDLLCVPCNLQFRS